jgi:hypothetical protein
MLREIAMRHYVPFIGWGLVVAALGEAVNNFVVGIEGVDAVGNFLFALGFYSVMLTLAFMVQRRFVRVDRPRTVWVYLGAFGIGIGLVLSEWLLVGNHPANPSVAHPLSQLAMIAFHTLVYGLPMVLQRLPSARSALLRVGAGVYGGVLVVALGVSLASDDPELIAGVSLLATYFIGYIGYWAYFLRRTQDALKSERRDNMVRSETI